MKTFFHGQGYRETKSWSCPCGNFHTYGIDLMVDQSAAAHKEQCKAYLKVDPVLGKLLELKDRVIALEKAFAFNQETRDLNLKLQKALTALAAIGNQAKAIERWKEPLETLKSISKIVIGTLEEIQ